MFPFNEIYPARSKEEALQLLQAHPEAILLAGGSDVLIQLRNGKLTDAALISIQQADDLRGIELEADETLKILPLTCFTDLEYSPLIHRTASVLAEAAGQVGGPQIRNIGTIGGNLCNGATSADTAATLLAYDAQLELATVSGKRVCSIHDFYLGPGRVDCRDGELLCAIRIPKTSYENYYGQYIKFATRNAMDIATLGCSVNVRLDAAKTHIDDVRIAFGVAGPTPLRARRAERALQGCAISEKLCRQAGKAVLDELTPRTSWRASREYRLALAETLTTRAMQHAIALAGGAI